MSPSSEVRVRVRSAAGFTLVETLVAVLVVSLIMGATFMSMTHAVRLSENARLSSGLNNNLRTSMDFVVRDLIQAGYGLPGTLHHVGVPSGTGATAINRPIPAAGSTDPAGFTTFPTGTYLTAVTVGYGAGIGGSDVITLLANDSRFENFTLTAASTSSSSATVTVTGTDPVSGAVRPLTRTNGGADNIQAGDLIDVINGSSDVLLCVTGVSGQTLTFANNTPIFDMLGLNQFGTGAGSATTVFGPAANMTVTRVKMISYYLFSDNSNPTETRYPRLVRRLKGDTPSTVGYGMTNFTFTYDLVNNDQIFNGVSMTNADAVVGNGVCFDTVNGVNRVCSPDWIRKISVVLAGRSLDRTSQKNYISNTLFSEVAVRSLAFQDRFK